MGEKNSGRPRPRWTTLRSGEITLAMGAAMASGLGVGLSALAVDTAWLSPPPVELATVAGARVLLGSVTGSLITVAVFGLWMRTALPAGGVVHLRSRIGEFVTPPLPGCARLFHQGQLRSHCRGGQPRQHPEVRTWASRLP